MYGYGVTMMFNSATAAIKAVADALFNRLSEDGINRMTEDNQQRIIAVSYTHLTLPTID
jgi:hypothetical protein